MKRQSRPPCHAVSRPGSAASTRLIRPASTVSRPCSLGLRESMSADAVGVGGGDLGFVSKFFYAVKSPCVERVSVVVTRRGGTRVARRPWLDPSRHRSLAAARPAGPRPGRYRPALVPPWSAPMRHRGWGAAERRWGPRPVVARRGCVLIMFLKRQAPGRGNPDAPTTPARPAFPPAGRYGLICDRHYLVVAPRE